MSARILVVDDEESIRFTFASFLSDEGHVVATAKSADEALDLVLREDYDLIFLDILLGGDCGVDLLRGLRERHCQCPVVLMTGFPTVDTAAEALRLGAFDYLPKPVNQQALLRVTRTALRLKQAEEEKRGSQAHLEAVFRGVRDAILTVDKELRLLSFNPAARTLCALSPEDLGRPFDLEERGCRGACRLALRKTLDEHQHQTTERFECRSPEGQARVLTLNTASLTDGRGRFSGAVLVVRDETRLVALERRLHESSRYQGLIGATPVMQSLYGLLEKLAPVSTAVLITGESGTGKELVADALHAKSPRRDGPLVKVNCAALSESLLETELFGHVKGAFTGAVRDVPGRFEKAQGGTIFLDEIGDISPRMQVRLLRVLQEKTIERVGDSTPVPVDVRVIAATHQDLPAKIRRGEFREDLFYRLKVVTVALPPLRERRADIPMLVAHFIKAFNRKFGRDVGGLSRDVERMFLAYDWPGNVRELEHVLEHAFILCDGPLVTAADLPPELLCATPRGTRQEGRADADFAQTLRRALESAGGNKAKAARLLGISRRTLYRKLEDFKIALD
ncbi:sigma-54 dependent transcriptional regulator [Geoalkalibacter sp.]|uniref:sigma-54 dependent transcriptional regulator n=1 Tax=Geoalkalibacter sp. TaxID=3041440 RepID=UPI00272DECF6|nr:sigma-54-dependent Fis family transcriptional regulator [Geoalkalibacter sp.]